MKPWEHQTQTVPGTLTGERAEVLHDHNGTVQLGTRYGKNGYYICLDADGIDSLIEALRAARAEAYRPCLSVV